MFAPEVINHLINHFNYKSYLEIGCQVDYTFNQIICEKKCGIDPIQGGTIRIASDDFFSQKPNEKFDIIFIDGFHHHDQVNRDIKNSLDYLSNNGSIVLHDCNPITLELEDQKSCGTAWRAFTKWRGNPNLRMAVGNFDHGVGIIQRGSPDEIIFCPKEMNDLNYDDLIANRQNWLNLKNENDLLSWATNL